MAEQRDWAAEHDALLPRLDEARELLSGYPGVVAVDLGIKETSGELTPVLAFRVYVSRKLPDSQLSQDARIPDTILGVPTDVIDYPSPPKLHDVVQGGTLVSDGGCLSSYGTLGCIAKRNSDGKIVILSNQHVFENVGERIGQPGCICLCCACGKIADVTKVQQDANVDCGIALLRDGVHASNVIAKLNDDGTDASLQGSAAAVVNGAVKKVGVTTGKTAGTIVSITFPTQPQGDPAKVNQILIKPTAAFKKFDAPGDSGSAIVDQNNAVVGLGYAGWDDGPMAGQTVACPIAAVTAAMDITIITGTFQHMGLSGPAERTAATDGLSAQDALGELRKLAESTTAGRDLVSRIARHHAEIAELINSNRRVTIAWHRGHGPTWLAAFVRSARVPAYVIPESVDGMSRRDFIASLRQAIESAASEELRAAITAHGDQLANSFAVHDTVRDMIEDYCSAAVL